MPRITICGMGNAIYDLQITLVFVKLSDVCFISLAFVSWEIRAAAVFDQGLTLSRVSVREDLTGEEHNDQGLGGAHMRTPLLYAHPDPLHHLMREAFALLPTQHRFPPIQASTLAPRVPPTATPFTQTINQTPCSQSLEAEGSLLAVCYDLHVVSTSSPKINICCSPWKAVGFTNNSRQRCWDSSGRWRSGKFMKQTHSRTRQVQQVGCIYSCIYINIHITTIKKSS